jgi:23S rRNA pseudouridine2605 synthase
MAEHSAMNTMAGDSSNRQGERVAKVIARAGLASRREAETWVLAGRVVVNGRVIRSPALNVGVNDRVAVDGTPLPARARTRLFLYHKPRGLVTTHADPQGRPTLFAALPKHLPRLVSVGRLDLNTEGLLLLTNDGGLARVLELPQTGWLRRYRVRAHGRVTQDQLDRLRNGVTIDGVRYGAIEASLDRAQGSNVWLTFAIREGKNREVKNVLGHLGLDVARLIRVSFGPFQLGDLAEGAIEEVKTRHLREQLGERIAALAGCDFSAPISDVIPSPQARDDIAVRPVTATRRASDRHSDREGSDRHGDREGSDRHGDRDGRDEAAVDSPGTLRRRGRDTRKPAASATIHKRGRGKDAVAPPGAHRKPKREKGEAASQPFGKQGRGKGKQHPRAKSRRSHRGYHGKRER